jgi:hypothetical protein
MPSGRMKLCARKRALPADPRPGAVPEGKRASGCDWWLLTVRPKGGQVGAEPRQGKDLLIMRAESLDETMA